ncbi:MAG: toast rack family protein [Anaerolineales bacterium]
MYKKQNLFVKMGLIAITLLITLGCSIATNLNFNTVETGEVQTKTETVELDDAEEVLVNVKMGAGELRIAPSEAGSEALMDAEFTYNVAAWEPRVSYKVNDNRGRLTIQQPNTDEFTVGGNLRYEWDLRFRDDAPLMLRIQCGAGDSELNLSALDIPRLDMKLGAGNANVDFSGNTSLERLEFDLGAGDLNLDLTGNWERNVDVHIQGGIGKTNLRLPKDIGVRIDVTQGIGDIETSGLEKRGGDYVNAAYEDADEVIEITIQAGIGAIKMEVED